LLVDCRAFSGEIDQAERRRRQRFAKSLFELSDDYAASHDRSFIVESSARKEWIAVFAVDPDELGQLLDGEE
jgi:hypothetical protein